MKTQTQYLNNQTETKSIVNLFFALLASVTLLGMLVLPAAGQTSDNQPTSDHGVPLVAQVSGILKDPMGKPRTGTLGITFALYKDSQGGDPLWLETQNVQLTEQGEYTVMIGSQHSDGLPADLFSSGDSHWLGVTVLLPNEQEQPRIQLVSVPYALKAMDSDTLGGRPASAYALADSVVAAPAQGSVKSSASSSSITDPVSIPDASPTVSGLVNPTFQAFGGTKSFLEPPMFPEMTPGSILMVGPSGLLSQDNTRLTYDGSMGGLKVGPRGGLQTDFGQFYIPYTRNLFSMDKSTHDSAVNTLASISEDYTADGLTGIYAETDSRHSSGTKEYVSSMESDVYVNAPSPAVTDFAASVNTYVSNGGSGTVNNAFGVRVMGNDNWGGGSVGNNYGIKVEDQSISGANNWAIRTGAGQVQFGDTVRVDKSFAAALAEVPAASSLVFDAAAANNFKTTITADMSSFTLLNGTPGQIVVLLFCQDLTGGHAIAWPSNMKPANGSFALSQAPNKCDSWSGMYDGGNWFEISRSSSM